MIDFDEGHVAIDLLSLNGNGITPIIIV